MCNTSVVVNFGELIKIHIITARLISKMWLQLQKLEQCFICVFITCVYYPIFFLNLISLSWEHTHNCRNSILIFWNYVDYAYILSEGCFKYIRSVEWSLLQTFLIFISLNQMFIIWTFGEKSMSLNSNVLDSFFPKFMSVYV